MTFGQWIRQQRATHRLTAAECAARAKMKPTVWSNWENDRSRRKDGKPTQPRRETVEAIAGALDAPIWEALSAAGLIPKSKITPSQQATFYLQRLPEAKQRLALQALESFCDALVSDGFYEHREIEKRR